MWGRNTPGRGNCEHERREARAYFLGLRTSRGDRSRSTARAWGPWKERHLGRSPGDSGLRAQGQDLGPLLCMKQRTTRGLGQKDIVFPRSHSGCYADGEMGGSRVTH